MLNSKKTSLNRAKFSFALLKLIFFFIIMYCATAVSGLTAAETSHNESIQTYNFNSAAVNGCLEKTKPTNASNNTYIITDLSAEIIKTDYVCRIVAEEAQKFIEQFNYNLQTNPHMPAKSVSKICVNEAPLNNAEQGSTMVVGTQTNGINYKSNTQVNQGACFIVTNHQQMQGKKDDLGSKVKNSVIETSIKWVSDYTYAVLGIVLTSVLHSGYKFFRTIIMMPFKKCRNWFIRITKTFLAYVAKIKNRRKDKNEGQIRIDPTLKIFIMVFIGNTILFCNPGFSTQKTLSPLEMVKIDPNLYTDLENECKKSYTESEEPEKTKAGTSHIIQCMNKRFVQIIIDLSSNYNVLWAENKVLSQANKDLSNEFAKFLNQYSQIVEDGKSMEFLVETLQKEKSIRNATKTLNTFYDKMNEHKKSVDKLNEDYKVEKGINETNKTNNVNLETKFGTLNQQYTEINTKYVDITKSTASIPATLAELNKSYEKIAEDFKYKSAYAGYINFHCGLRRMTNGLDLTKITELIKEENEEGENDEGESHFHELQEITTIIGTIKNLIDSINSGDNLQCSQ